MKPNGCCSNSEISNSGLLLEEQNIRQYNLISEHQNTACLLQFSLLNTFAKQFQSINLGNTGNLGNH